MVTKNTIYFGNATGRVAGVGASPLHYIPAGQKKRLRNGILILQVFLRFLYLFNLKSVNFVMVLRNSQKLHILPSFVQSL